LESGYDIEGAIKTIDDAQWYDGIIGQTPPCTFLEFKGQNGPKN
jgi:hypothetical protein